MSSIKKTMSALLAVGMLAASAVTAAGYAFSREIT